MFAAKESIFVLLKLKPDKPELNDWKVLFVYIQMQRDKRKLNLLEICLQFNFYQDDDTLKICGTI